MNASPYSNATALRSPRDIEYAAFARITARLTSAQDGEFAKLAEALHENRKLWDVLAADVASDDNELTPQLRAQLFYLAEFSRQHGSKVLQGQATASALIDINTAIMRGLRAANQASQEVAV